MSWAEDPEGPCKTLAEDPEGPCKMLAKDPAVVVVVRLKMCLSSWVSPWAHFTMRTHFGTFALCDITPDSLMVVVVVVVLVLLSVVVVVVRVSL